MPFESICRTYSTPTTGLCGGFLARAYARLALLLLPVAAAVCSPEPGRGQTALRDLVRPLGFKIAYESYVDGNSDIYAINSDGSEAVNLTRTPSEQEHYPQVSPDGTKICYVSDVGEGRETVRSVWVMEVTGQNRRRVAEHAREPFWSPDGKVIGFLPQEYPRFNVIDYSTKGMSFYQLSADKVVPHVNSARLHHLYNPSWSPNGKWIAATVHAGMGVDHAILLIEAQGTNIINLKIPGCRPCFSPDGKQLAWGAEDHDIVSASIDLDGERPAVGKWNVHIQDKTNKIYHVDWSPDSQFLALSRGPDGGGDPAKPGTHQAAAEIHGVYAKGWNLAVVKVDRAAHLDLGQAGAADFFMLTTNGLSNKEPAWFRARPNH